jgi:hypothetical protein
MAPNFGRERGERNTLLLFVTVYQLHRNMSYISYTWSTILPRLNRMLLPLLNRALLLRQTFLPTQNLFQKFRHSTLDY